MPDELNDFWGPPIYVYSRSDALADGELVDVTEWASADNGFLGGFICPVALTRALWALVDVDARKARESPFPSTAGRVGRSDHAGEDTRGRAHDVLWMASLALRRVLPRQRAATFRVLLGGRLHTLHVATDAEGVTIGLPEDF